MSDNTKRSLQNLKDMLLIQIQNIQNPEEEMNIEEEIKKSKALCDLANTIVNIDNLELNAVDTFIKLKKSGVEISDTPALYGILQ